MASSNRRDRAMTSSTSRDGPTHPWSAFTLVFLTFILTAACEGEPFQPEPLGVPGEATPEVAPERDPAPAGADLAGRVVSFESRAVTGKCIEVRGSSVVVAACDEGASQSFAWNGDGPIKRDDLCVATKSAGGPDGDPLVVEACDGGANQSWRETAAGEIRGIGGKCMDVYYSAAVKRDGVPVKLWGCGNGTNQQWDVHQASGGSGSGSDDGSDDGGTGDGSDDGSAGDGSDDGSTGDASTDTGSDDGDPASDSGAGSGGGSTGGGSSADPSLVIESVAVAGKCLQVEDDDVTVAACDGGSDQRFIWDRDGAIHFADLCVATRSSNGRDGDPLVVEACDGGGNQTWRETAAGEIRGVGRCMDIYYGAAAQRDGVPVKVWGCGNGTNQQWEVRQASGSGSGGSGGSNDGGSGGSNDDGSSDGGSGSGGSSDGGSGSGGSNDGGSGSGGGATRAGFYVAPSGSSGGNGSAGRPWDLRTALRHPGAVQPGDTIWLRDGTYVGQYTSQLRGTSGAPIVVRELPGEEAVIDGLLDVQGANAAYWGLEVVRRDPSATFGNGITVFAPGTRLINCVVHGQPKNGIGVWESAIGAEVSGCIVFRNGHNRNEDPHGIYTQNHSGTKVFRDNIVFHNKGFGFHGYTQDKSIQGFVLDGNVAFLNGPGQPDFHFGGGQPVERLTMTGNMSWNWDLRSAPSVQVGTGHEAGGASNRDIQITGNYFVGGLPALSIFQPANVTVRNNTLVSDGRSYSMAFLEGSPNGLSWGQNTLYGDPNRAEYLHLNVQGPGQHQSYHWSGWKSNLGLGRTDRYAGSRPTGTKVFVRPNRYEAGRGHVVVYDWSGSGSAAVDLSGVLSPGDRYEVHNVLRLNGSPVRSGTYGGGTVSLPMQSISDRLFGNHFPGTPRFNVFLVRRLP